MEPPGTFLLVWPLARKSSSQKGSGAQLHIFYRHPDLAAMAQPPRPWTTHSLGCDAPKPCIHCQRLAACPSRLIHRPCSVHVEQLCSRSRKAYDRIQDSESRMVSSHCGCCQSAQMSKTPRAFSHNDSNAFVNPIPKYEVTMTAAPVPPSQYSIENACGHPGFSTTRQEAICSQPQCSRHVLYLCTRFHQPEWIVATIEEVPNAT